MHRKPFARSCLWGWGAPAKPPSLRLVGPRPGSELALLTSAPQSTRCDQPVVFVNSFWNKLHSRVTSENDVFIRVRTGYTATEDAGRPNVTHSSAWGQSPGS